MLRNLRVLLFASLLVLTGCVEGNVQVTVLPDGSGSIAIDLGYDPESWPAMFGDPYAGFRTREQMQRWTDPGMTAWSRPVVVESDESRRWRGEVFFDDLSRVQFLGRRDGQVFEAMGFDVDLDAGRIGIRPGFLVFLDDPLPLPAPERVGMSGVSLSPALLDAIRQRIRPVVEGLDVTLQVVLPGEVTRASGLDGFDGRTAYLHVDADRLTRAFNDRAAALTDVEALRNDPAWSWRTPADPSRAGTRALHARREAARTWWSVDE